MKSRIENQIGHIKAKIDSIDAQAEKRVKQLSKVLTTSPQPPSAETVAYHSEGINKDRAERMRLCAQLEIANYALELVNEQLVALEEDHESEYTHEQVLNILRYGVTDNPFEG